MVVRGDVRKDDEGFEDIDEFWADDDAGDRDDDEDDDECKASTTSWTLFRVLRSPADIAGVF